MDRQTKFYLDNKKYNEAIMYLQEGRIKDAFVDFDTAIKLGFKDHRAYNGRGLCYKEMGLHNFAINDLDKAIEFNKTNKDLIMNRAHSHMSLKDHKHAEEDFCSAIGLKYPNHNPLEYFSIFSRKSLDEGKDAGNSLIKAGFNLKIEKNDEMLAIMPCTHNRIILPLIHFSAKKDVLSHLQKHKDSYEFKMESDIDSLMNKDVLQYLESIDIDKDKLRYYLSLDNIVCFVLYKDKSIVAWEIGILNERTYSSIIRYYNPAEPLAGKIRITLLVEHLRTIGITLIDFGSSKDKWNNLSSFGAENIDTQTYLQLFKEINSCQKNVLYIGDGKIKENITGEFKMVLLNNDDATQGFVVDILMKMCSLELYNATMTMLEIHRNGKGIVGTTSAEIAVTLVEYLQKMAKDNGFKLICLLEEV